VDGWFCPQGTENRPSPCIDFSMSFSYKKIHKVCAVPNLILMSEGFWVIVKNDLLCWTLRELQKSFCPFFNMLSPFLSSFFRGNFPSRLFKHERRCLCESNMNEAGHSLALWLSCCDWLQVFDWHEALREWAEDQGGVNKGINKAPSPLRHGLKIPSFYLIHTHSIIVYIYVYIYIIYFLIWAEIWPWHLWDW